MPYVTRFLAFCRSVLLTLQEIWSLVRLDLLLWLRMPLAIVSALIPPLGMAIMLVVLSWTVTQEPVALVIQSQGAYAKQMAEIIEADTDAYQLSVTSMQEATRLLQDQYIAAIIIIPADFDQKVVTRSARLQVILNNVDIDFSDDIRRSVDRSVGRFDGLQVTAGADTTGGPAASTHPYHVIIDEHTLRTTDVDFLRYQVLPVFILLLLSTGLMGTSLLCAQDIERGTARYLALAPCSAWALVAGRLLGGLLVSLAVLIPPLAACLLTGVIAPPLDHWPALLCLFIATALSASGMGALLGTVLRGARNIAMMATILATYLFFLGGGFTTIAFLPLFLRDLSVVNPIRYAIDGMRQALFYPDLSGFSTDLAVLGGTALLALLFGSLAVRRSWSS
jgi:ABC-type transport system involved in multi-copper enzyme maturation permease subunit